MRRILFVVVLCLCFAPWMKGTEGDSLWLDIPFVKQDAEGCGAASIAMVMQYWEKQKGRSPDGASEVNKIQRALHSRRAHGIYASEMQKYLRQNGFETFAFSAGWTDLRHHLEKGRPLIVAVKTAGGALHYVVVSGIDDEHHGVLVNDPGQRKLLQYDRADFERDWSATANWMLLALPRGSAS